jgi:hypothetical protein
MTRGLFRKKSIKTKPRRNGLFRKKSAKTKKYHGGRGGVLETGSTQSMTYASSPAPFAGGKRGMPISHLPTNAIMKKHVKNITHKGKGKSNK